MRQATTTLDWPPLSGVLSNLKLAVGYYWSRLGLTNQFLVIAFLMIAVLSVWSARIQNNIAANTMVESSLEVEQALVTMALTRVVGDAPLRERLDATQRARIIGAVSLALNTRFIDKIKLWGVDGALLYDSSTGVPETIMGDASVMAALSGEKVMSPIDSGSYENSTESNLDGIVYEVYMPLRNADGQIIGVAEIYCSTALLLKRVNQMIRSTDALRTAVLFAGFFLVWVLTRIAQQKIVGQGRALQANLEATQALARRNAELLAESVELRRASAEAGDRLLHQIGADLHDGPIQLLSIASLYQSQVSVNQGDQDSARKSRELTEKALKALRNISTDLILPAIAGLTLQEALEQVVMEFQSDTGLKVALNLDGRPEHLPQARLVAAYRIVQESLNNCRKHAPGADIELNLRHEGAWVVVEIRDSGPGLNHTRPSEPAARGLGILGMESRVRSVGGRLDFVSLAGGGTCVKLTLPLMADA